MIRISLRKISREHPFGDGTQSEDELELSAEFDCDSEIALIEPAMVALRRAHAQGTVELLLSAHQGSTKQ